MDKHLTFKWKDLTFHIRSKATRRDQYEMHATMADAVDLKDGRTIVAKASLLHPWLIERFVTGWEGPKEPWSLDALYNQPADPGEDLILVLGSYILNHCGLVVSAEQAERKNA